MLKGESTFACGWLQVITPYHIYFNAWLILQKMELWRLLTNFFFFGSLGAVLKPNIPQ